MRLSATKCATASSVISSVVPPERNRKKIDGKGGHEQSREQRIRSTRKSSELRHVLPATPVGLAEDLKLSSDPFDIQMECEDCLEGRGEHHERDENADRHRDDRRSGDSRRPRR
jgi:hypothetical protein